MKLFIVGWGTNYGDCFALVKADSLEEVRTKIGDGHTRIWDGYSVEEYNPNEEEDIKYLEY